MKRLLLFVLSVAPAAALPASVHDITAHGAVADGKTNNAAAIQKAIDACAKAGGGTVYIPAGDFVSGTIVLRSRVSLHLSPGATLWGSTRIEDYQPRHLIYAEDAENVTIEGAGTINGNGEHFWEPGFKAKPARPSPLIVFLRCRNVRILDVRIRNTPGWGIHPLACDGVYIRGISMITDMRGPNTDGIDPDSSRNVIISDCYIDSGDDAICLKTSARGGNAACENIAITNCVLKSEDSAIKIGTGSTGDFRNVTVSNTVISGTRYGITMFVKDGALVESVRFSNMVIDTSAEHFNRTTGSRRAWSEYPIVIDLEKRTPQSPLGRIRDVTFSGITIRGEGRAVVAGSPERALENLVFRDIVMRVTGFENIEKERKPRGVAGMPPAPREADYAPAPAAFTFAHVRGLELREIKVLWDAPPPAADRHAIFASNVEDLLVEGFSGGPAGARLAAIGLERVRGAAVRSARLTPGTPVFLGLRGTPQDELRLVDNALGGARATEEGSVYAHLP